MRARNAILVVLLVAAPLGAAPPALDFPAELRPSGDYCQYSPKGDGVVSVTYVGLSSVDPFPAALLKDGRTFVLPTRGLTPGRYRFAAVASSATGEQSRADFVVIVPDPAPAPNPDPPAPDFSFVRDLRAAVLADGADAALLPNLSAFYAGAAALADANDTWVGFFRSAAVLANEKGVSGKLKATQGVVSADLARAGFPASATLGQKITAEEKAKVKAAFGRAVAALAKL